MRSPPQVITITVPGSSASYRDAPGDTGDVVALRVRIQRAAPSKTVDLVVTSVVIAFCGAMSVAALVYGAWLSLALAFFIGFSALTVHSIVQGAAVARARAQCLEIGRWTIHAWDDASRRDRRPRRDMRLQRAAIVAIQIGWSDDDGLLRVHRLADGPLEERAAPFAIVARDASGKPHALIKGLDRIADAWTLAVRVHGALGPDVALDIPREFFDPPGALAGSP